MPENAGVGKEPVGVVEHQQTTRLESATSPGYLRSFHITCRRSMT
jgi:hypothetical protein